MPRFEVKQSAKLNLTSYSGLALIGQCCQAAQVEAVIDPRLPVSQGMRSSDLVKSVVGLLSLGKSDFEAIEPFRGDRFFKEALGLAKVPGSVWMRQRLDARAAELRELTDELSLRLLERTEAPITAHKGYVCADLDTFVMDNSDTKKEAVSRTYQGVDGYTPIALYLGNEGWNLGLELRAGSHHSALETEYFFERAFRACAGCARPMRSCCGGPTAASTAPGCCSRWPTSAIAGQRWGVRSTTSPSGIRAVRTRPPGWTGPRPPASSRKCARASGWGCWT
jgi:hypothetical protein